MRKNELNRADLKPTPLEKLPQVGQSLKMASPPPLGVMAGAGQIYRAYRVSVQGVVYDVGVSDDRVQYLGTNDGRFKSPEGLHVGSSLADVLAHAQGTLKKEAGWGYFVLLKSGWSVGFTSGSGLTDHPESELPKNLQAQWFFKR